MQKSSEKSKNSKNALSAPISSIFTEKPEKNVEFKSYSIKIRFILQIPMQNEVKMTGDRAKIGHEPCFQGRGEKSIIGPAWPGGGLRVLPVVRIGFLA